MTAAGSALSILSRVVVQVQADEDSDGSDHSVPVWVKMVALVALIVIALFGGAVPLFWKRLRDSSVALSHLNAFSGGVFLAMAFVHLLPEAQEEMEAYHIDYPLSYAL